MVKRNFIKTRHTKPLPRRPFTKNANVSVNGFLLGLLTFLAIFGLIPIFEIISFTSFETFCQKMLETLNIFFCEISNLRASITKSFASAITFESSAIAPVEPVITPLTLNISNVIPDIQMSPDNPSFFNKTNITLALCGICAIGCIAFIILKSGSGSEFCTINNVSTNEHARIITDIVMDTGKLTDDIRERQLDGIKNQLKGIVTRLMVNSQKSPPVNFSDQAVKCPLAYLSDDLA